MDRKKVGKPRDKFWDHAEVMPNEGEAKDRWKCKFCHKQFSGGASRIKAHLGKVEGKGIKVCEGEVDEATMHEANEALEKSTKRRKVDAGTNSAQVNPQQVAADLQITMSSPGQSNPNAPAPLQQSPHPIHQMSSPLLVASMDNLDISDSQSIFGDSSANLLREVCSGAMVEGPSNADVYNNERSSIPCSSFVTEEADRSGWPKHNTPQPEDQPYLQEDQCTAYVHELIEIANAPSLEIQSMQPDGPDLLPEDVQPSLPESTRNVRPCAGDNPVQHEPNLVAKDHEANSIMLEQTNHFDPMRIDPNPNNEDNGDSALVLPSSAPNSFVRETIRREMLAPKLVGRERIVDELWDYLMTNDTLCIGVYGMGGVGKTTTMKHLYNKVHNSVAFENVFWVTVSKDCSTHELQNKIARALKVSDLFKDVDQEMRPTLLFNHLSEKKKCLVILDDMWQHFELADVGIPVKRDGVRLSYNRLDEKRQLCFLTCALYPEDWLIPRQELIELCIDEGVIREDKRRKMYNEGHRLLDELEKACLLEAGGRGVRMHDVIRDMALHIMNVNSAPCMVKSGLGLEDVPDDEDDWKHNLQKVSLMRNDIMAVPRSISPNCPQLATLLLSYCLSLRKISKRFFQRMQGLKVIDLRRTSITEVPKSVMNLKKLNALILNRCFELSRIPSLAKLTSLRKLDLEGCINIKEVPDGLGMLVNLTYLSLRETGIERIPDAVVCKLKKLQHLEAGSIAVKGEEVGKLRKLEALRCRFENVNELNEYALCATTIESYTLVVGAHAYDEDCVNFFNSGKVIIMDEGEYKIGETCHLPRDVKALWIREYGGTWNISSFKGLEELEELQIEGCDEVSTLSGNGGQPEDHCPNLKALEISRCPKLQHLLVPRHSCNLYLKKLEKLEIRHCEELESIIDEEQSPTSSTSPLPPDAFSQLQSVEIVNCPKMKMKRVLTLESFMPIPNLQTINVHDCEEMEELIGGQELDHEATSSFEELQSIRGAATGEEESLTSSIKIDNCPNMKYGVGPKSLPVLREIELSGCDKMKRVLTLESFMLLPNLERMIVRDCKEMKEVIDHGATSSLLLSPIPAASPGDQLSTRNLSLHLSLLPELESICSWIGLRDLIHVIEISGCPKLKRIEMLDDASLPPSLKEIVLIDEVDLAAAVRDFRIMDRLKDGEVGDSELLLM
ncbi:hypothetical protein CRG98_044274 [Punica granatum]|uniref:BED-type domain-containing protein n=1 Tax=Punica granatum TaxID=22663 RepID=A0A2I0HUE8_PUNGR|nr:hypothetical protein CRG98_044274 [Punica granatum]